MKRISLRVRQLLRVVMVCAAIWGYPASCFAEAEYSYERMWPVLQQPWYFNEPHDIAASASGHVYVADEFNHAIQKFTSDGVFLTRWGTLGNGESQFEYPSGVAVDSSGNVYVADRTNHRIQKFTANGGFLTAWGREGEGNGQFNFSMGAEKTGIAVDTSGNVYVADTWNHRIQKFTSNGVFITAWGRYGSGAGEFDTPAGVAIDASGSVYVTDMNNHRVQKFTAEGALVVMWGGYGDENGDFKLPYGITADPAGNIYVTEWEGYRIQKFTASGAFLRQWGKEGAGDGQLRDRAGIAVDTSGQVYVADLGNHRIQKFTSNGAFVTKWASGGDEDGRFDKPSSIVADIFGNVYLTDPINARIHKFSQNGAFVKKWGREGTGNGQFAHHFFTQGPNGVAVDSSGDVYVVDTVAGRIQKFSPEGIFLTAWGSPGNGAGQFFQPHGIAADALGHIYVADSWNNRIQKFTSEGRFVTQWGSLGDGNGQFSRPRYIAVDASGNVYVADTGNQRIQKFTASGQFVTQWRGSGAITVDTVGNVYVADSENQRVRKFTSTGVLISSWGGPGTGTGEFNNPQGIAVDSSGTIYVADTGNSRVQVFTQGLNTARAIIVAGSGPYATNTLWSATEMNANMAYRALNYQGYAKDQIYYLSANTKLRDDTGRLMVNADATNANLESAIKTWARGTGDLLIYMVGHGGQEKFRMGELEVLSAAALNSWLDDFQSNGAAVVVLYDACHSGSFISRLKPPAGRQRLAATSAAADQLAAFINHGTMSFSFQFWSNFLTGLPFYDAYVRGKDGMRISTDGIGSGQTAQLDANGNGIPNEKADMESAAALKVGKETAYAADIPLIGAVSPAQELTSGSSARIHAANVISVNGISRVWAVITPPGYPVTAEQPVLDVPVIDLSPQGGSRYEAVFEGFSRNGVYYITIYATDDSTLRMTSLPKSTTVTVRDGSVVNYTLRVQSENPESGVEIASTSEHGGLTGYTRSIADGTSVTLTAPEYHDRGAGRKRFSHWSGSISSTSHSISFIMDAHKTVTAAFSDAPEEDATLTIHPASRDHSASGATDQTIAVTTAASWIASGDQAWITITSSASGVGAGAVTYRVAPNSGAARSGAITVTAGAISRTFTITQAGSMEFNLSVESSNPESGVRIATSSGHGGQTPYTRTLSSGVSVSLTAPEYHSDGGRPRRFSHWSGSVSSAGLTISFTMDNHKTLIAHYVNDDSGFEPDPGDLSAYQGRHGEVFQFQVTGDVDGFVWGSDIYTDDSELATAAVHYGLVMAGQTAIVTVMIMPGRASYTGSTRNGVTSHSDDEWLGSFVFLGADSPCLVIREDLSLFVPCAAYEGFGFMFDLQFYHKPSDPFNLYWNMDMATLEQTFAHQACIQISATLGLPVPCLLILGDKYGFRLDYYHNPSDTSTLYWKMDLDSLTFD